MAILGLVLLILGLILGIGWLFIVGIVLLVVGLVYGFTAGTSRRRIW